MLGIVTCSRKKGDADEMYWSFQSTLEDCILFESTGYNNIADGYNDGMKRALAEKDINAIVFTHSDVRNMASMHAFDCMYDIMNANEASTAGFFGVAGTQRLHKSGRWWDSRMEDLRGSVAHKTDKLHYQSIFGQGLFDEPVAVLDGVFLCAHRYALENFTWRGEGFHFYDLQACIDMQQSGRTNYVVNIPLMHFSIGNTNKDFEDLRMKFIAANKLPIHI